MLVVSRKIGEVIVVKLGDLELCRVMLCDVWHGKARIGIEADRSIQVMREELLLPPREPAGPARQELQGASSC